MILDILVYEGKGKFEHAVEQHKQIGFELVERGEDEVLFKIFINGREAYKKLRFEQGDCPACIQDTKLYYESKQIAKDITTKLKENTPPATEKSSVQGETEIEKTLTQDYSKMDKRSKEYRAAKAKGLV